MERETLAAGLRDVDIPKIHTSGHGKLFDKCEAGSSGDTEHAFVFNEYMLCYDALLFLPS